MALVPPAMLAAPLGLAHLESRLLDRGQGLGAWQGLGGRRRHGAPPPSRTDPATHLTAPGWAADDAAAELASAT